MAAAAAAAVGLEAVAPPAGAVPAGGVPATDADEGGVRAALAAAEARAEAAELALESQK